MKASKTAAPALAARPDPELLQRIAHRAFVFATKMIYEANHRPDQHEGDPKVGGHPAACSSCVHILSAIHLAMRQPQDWLAVKPHGSPVDHSLNHLMGLFHTPSGREWLTTDAAKEAMTKLRAFSKNGEPVFQSYHAENDPDGNAFFPSGSVGIPPVVSMYTALAYRYAEDHGLDVPKNAYFWSLMGDSEFREGSLMEAMPDASERELGNVIWIVDYNRQNLDGTRIPNNRGLRGTDAHRMERVGAANGWEVIQVRHGKKRQALFAKDGGAELQRILEDGFSDFEFQMMLLKRDGKVVRSRLLELAPALKNLLATVDDAHLYEVFSDLGGHDLSVLLDAFERAKHDRLRPTLVIVHTIKGWGLQSYAAPGNHSALPDGEEVDALLDGEGLSKNDPFALFPEDSDEGRYLAKRRAEMRKGIEETWALKDRNEAQFNGRLADAGGFPAILGVDLKLTPLVHTQYVWGQLAGKLIRIGNRHEAQRKAGLPSKELTEDERRWGPAADLVLTMAPDVGTSTNINPAMDEKIYGPVQPDFESQLGLRDRRRPTLVPHEEAWTRHIRFEIAEANCMSAVGAFGKMRDHVGLPFLPVMTIYDFFIKRAYDQLYYNLYWKSGFICVGTPSGVTLSPEGAQHSWKSDIQMPNLITWEPFFAHEVDWILAESVRRHFTGDDAGRSGVLIRCVTKAFRQDEFPKRLKLAKRFEGTSDVEMFEATRKDALEGGYYLVDWRGYPDYQPGDNVVNLFAMGAMVAEALKASDRLRADGIYANVLVVTSNDLLAGNLGHETDYRHLREGLGITGDLFLARPTGNGNGHATQIDDRAELVTVAGRRVPLVTVVDGEPGLLDNLGSIVGVKSEDLAVRKPSKCGRPEEVYAYLHIDADAIYEAAGSVLAGTAVENVRVSPALLEGRANDAASAGNAEARGELWPPRR